MLLAALGAEEGPADQMLKPKGGSTLTHLVSSAGQFTQETLYQLWEKASAAPVFEGTVSKAAETLRPAGAGSAGKIPEWNDPAVFQMNSEPAHATLMPYDGVEQALRDDRAKSSYRLQLDGHWRFNWAKNAGSRVKDFFEDSFDDSFWKTIPVPSSWQLHGYDFPIYTNFTYPWTGRNGEGEQPAPIGDYPHAPTIYNPVGQYRRTIRSRRGGMDVKCSFTLRA